MRWNDVLSISYGGDGSWVPLNTKLGRPRSVVYADFDGDGTTDVAKSEIGTKRKVTWSVSYAGRSAWTALRSFVDEGSMQQDPPPEAADLTRHWIGRFDANRGADALRYPWKPSTTPVERWLQISSGARKNVWRSVATRGRAG